MKPETLEKYLEVMNEHGCSKFVQGDISIEMRGHSGSGRPVDYYQRGNEPVIPIEEQLEAAGLSGKRKEAGLYSSSGVEPPNIKELKATAKQRLEQMAKRDLNDLP